MAPRTHLIDGPAGALEILLQSDEAESGQKPTALLLHGIQGTASIWRPVADRLATHSTCVAPNLRGRGGSVKPDRPEAYEMSAFADDLAAVIGHCRRSDGRPLFLVAWSMGVLVTLAFLAKNGGADLDRIVLVSGTCFPGDEAVWFKGGSIAEIETEALARAETLGLTETAEPRAVAGSWLSARQADFRDMLPAIRLPVLVIHGTDDAECPVSHGRLMAERIPGARLSVWEGGPHNLMAADPARFAAEVGAFLGEARPI